MAKRRGARGARGGEAAARTTADAAAAGTTAPTARLGLSSSEGTEADTLGLGLAGGAGDAGDAVEPGTVVRPPRQDPVNAAAGTEMVVVDELHTSVGLPNGGALYGPGKNLTVPAELARRLGLEGRPVPQTGDAGLGTGAAPEGEGNGGEEDVPPYDTWLRDELVAEAEGRNLTVTRADGQDGEPLVTDYIAALEASDAADEAAGSEQA